MSSSGVAPTIDFDPSLSRLQGALGPATEEVSPLEAATTPSVTLELPPLIPAPATPCQLPAKSSEEPRPPATCCPNCQAPAADAASWCRRCGYYAVLGKCVELAPWERELDSGPQDAQTGRERKLAALRCLPSWAWTVSALTLAIVGVSLAARFLTAPGTLRASWGAGQFLIGLGAFAFAHGLAFVHAMSHLDQCGLLDIVLRPLSLWSPIVRQLPHRLWQVCLAVGGLTAVVCAAAIVGVPYDLLLDWNIAQRPKASLAKAVRQAQTGANDQAAPAQPPVAPPPPELAESTDCVVIGYHPAAGDGGDFTSLVVATMVKGRLRVVGRVSDGIDEATRNELRQRLNSIRRPTPFLPCSDRAVWVEPRVVCRVRFAAWTRRDMLQSPRFESLLTSL